jgi:S1-C subfamily serine protease
MGIKMPHLRKPHWTPGANPSKRESLHWGSQCLGNTAHQYLTRIVNETANSPAAAAGLKSGDVILQVDNKPVTAVQSVSDALMGKNPDNTVVVTAYRGSQRLTFNIKLGELQASG